MEGEPIDPVADLGLTPAQIREALNSGDLELQTGGSLGYRFIDTTTQKITYGVKDPVTGAMVFVDENPWATDPTNTAAGLTVFTSADERGRPDPRAALRDPLNPSSIANANPFMSDSSLSPKDLRELAASGALNLDEDQLVAYRARLEREERSRQLTMESRDRSYEATGSPTRGSTMAGGVAKDTRGIAARMRENMDTLRDAMNVILNSSGSPDERGTTFGAPPTAFTPPPIPKPAPTPKPISSSPVPTTTPKPTIKPPSVVVKPDTGAKAKPGIGAATGAEDEPTVSGGGGGGKKRA
jgi:hypothetical protein